MYAYINIRVGQFEASKNAGPTLALFYELFPDILPTRAWA